MKNYSKLFPESDAVDRASVVTIIPGTKLYLVDDLCKVEKTVMRVSRNSFAASLALGTFNPLTRETDAL